MALLSLTNRLSGSHVSKPGTYAYNKTGCFKTFECYLFKTVFYNWLLKLSSNSHFTSSSVKSRPHSTNIIDKESVQACMWPQSRDNQITNTKCQKLKSKYSKKYNCSKNILSRVLLQKSLTKL